MNYRSILCCYRFSFAGLFCLGKASAEPPPPPPPTPKPLPTPTAQIAPRGVLIVVKRFSVMVADGVHGFAMGKQVRLVKENGEFLVVTDGIIEARVSKDHFASDLAEADKRNQLKKPYRRAQRRWK